MSILKRIFLSTLLTCAFQKLSAAEEPCDLRREEKSAVEARLEELDVSYLTVPRGNRTVVRLKDAAFSQAKWVNVAMELKHLFGVNVEIDDVPLAYAGTSPGENRVFLDPTASLNDLLAHFFLYHEKVHNQNNLAFIEKPESAESNWVSYFSSEKVLSPRLNASYQRLVRPDELMAFYESILFWKQIAETHQHDPQAMATARTELREAQDRLREFMPLLPQMMTLAKNQILEKMQAGDSLPLTDFGFFWPEKSKRHMILQMQITTPKGMNYNLSIPYLNDKPLEDGESLMISDGEQIATRIQALATLIQNHIRFIEESKVLDLTI